MHRLTWLWLLCLLGPSCVSATSWKQAIKEKETEIDLYWYTSIPFIKQEENGNYAGIEYEIVLAFKDYLRERHSVDLRLNWIEAESFNNIFEMVRDTTRNNVVGVSAFSITEERQTFAQFSDPYLPDVMVLVSSEGTQIVQSLDEIDLMMSGMVAVTIEGTTYEKELIKMRDQLGVDFELYYIGSDQNILAYISQADNRFGFIDLPIYLMLVKEGGELVRQNFFTVEGTGYGLIMPKNSDWNVPFNEFLKDKKYRSRVDAIMAKHLGSELFNFLENMRGDLGTSILTEEKRMQLELIRNANTLLHRERTYKRLVGIAAIGFLVLFSVIGSLFLKNRKATKVLLEQKAQIENQKEDIHRKNDQLLNRNRKLKELNEKKSSLVQMLAHDLRSPLSQITGMSDLAAKSAKVDDEEKELILGIQSGAERMNKMISKLLDFEVVEGRQEVLRERISSSSMVKEVYDRYKSEALSKKLEFFFDPGKKEIVLETDHLMLLQVLENLVSNAIKFSEEGGLVVLSSQVEEKEVVFHVKDEGPGFTKTDLKGMYSPFKKLSAKPTAGEVSTGLGLSIVKKCVEELGGKIQVETEEGKGTNFMVALPINKKVNPQLEG